ncbi:hypothetical protein [Nocardia suismassiliense]|uniref:hypothetical protein n=1 Tax=Nocardia suismassiliense TaxID=2077092 RepID=UPI000D1D7527|nr:hypothetical protein [Nocardia suismassiliense]
MSWLERRTGPNTPEHYPDAADADEARLRADAAHWYYLREIAKSADTPEQSAAWVREAGALAVTWSRHESVSRRIQWQRLRDAFTKWTNSPDQAAREMRDLERAVAAGMEGVDEIGLRNLRQAGAQTGRWEPGITGSEHYNSHLEPVTRTPSAAADASADRGAGTAPASIVDSTPPWPRLLARALGVPQHLQNLDEAGAIIAETEQATGATQVFDISTVDDRAAVADQSRSPKVTTEPSGTPQQQLQALQTLQDLYAEHTRTVGSFNDLTADTVTSNLAKVAELEQIMTAARNARVVAAQAGASTEVIRSVSLAGQSGTYWREGPGDPRLNSTADVGPHVDPASGHHNDTASPDPPAQVTNATPGGVAIDQAIEDASAEAEPTDWHGPVRPEVNRSTPPQDAARDPDF